MISERILNSILTVLTRKNKNIYILYKSKEEIGFIEIFTGKSKSIGIQ